jgi:hypothetical protein
MYWWELPNPFSLFIILFKTKKILPINYSLHPIKTLPNKVVMDSPHFSFIHYKSFPS